MKADVQNISGELIVSGLDSATSLIQAAKNLMNTVVVTVKASYVASTKYRSTRVAVSWVAVGGGWKRQGQRAEAGRGRARHNVWTSVHY